MEPINNKETNTFPDQLPVKTYAETIQELSDGLAVHGSGISPRKPIQSTNFVEGATGYRIDTNGNAEFNDGTFRGTFNIGGTTITIDNTQDIQTNLDLISTEGGGTLYLQPGTYTLTADITIPSGVRLEGVNRDGVIINCNTSYAVKIVGTNVYSTGTVTINNGDTTLEGAGTTWTAAMVGRYVLLDGLWYEITARTDNDTLTIEAYQGVNLAGASYVLADTNFNASINKVTITGATNSGLVVQYAMEPNLYDLVVYGNGTGIEMDYVVFPRIVVTSNENGVNLNLNYVSGFKIDFSEFSFSTTGNGITMANSGNSTFFDSSANDNTGDGVNMTSCDKIAWISFDISGNGGQGVEMVSGCDANSFVGGSINDNTSDGIKLTATDDRNTIVACEITGNGAYGINIAAATCDNNQIIAPAFNNNSSGNINDSGTSTFVSPQTLGSNVQTFTSSGTWTKPSSGTMALIQVWGAGGSGAKDSLREAGNGGGGGYNEIFLPLSSLGATETVTIGAGGASVSSNGVGLVGGNTTFGSILTGYGGGGGGYSATDSAGGGGGGGSNSVGLVGSGTDIGGDGGGLLGGTGGTGAGDNSTFGGGGGGGSSTGGHSIFGGGGGAASTSTGGSSTYGGGGGGGTPGTSKFGGTGGTAGATGTAGTQPGGGGGKSTSGNSGAGGAGMARVTTF